MKIYNYDANGMFIGSSEADESPLEEGVFLIPAMATDKDPLLPKDGFNVVFNGKKWEYIELPKIKPEQPNEYSVWDEVSWSWIEDTDLKKQYDNRIASIARDEAMLKGFVYNGMDISVTKDDGDGMVQVKVSFELGLTSTVIHFANGSKLPMSAEAFPAFALQFVTERGKFFS